MKKSTPLFLSPLTALIFSAALLTACNTLPKDETGKAKVEYKADVTSCAELTGVEHSMCIQDANKDMSASAVKIYNTAVATAETDYQSSVAKCKTMTADAIDSCIKDANSAREKAISKAQKTRTNVISTEKKTPVE